MIRHAIAILLGALASGRASADEVIVDVTFSNGFELIPSTVFRMGSLALRDPHVFYPFLSFCIDGTDELNGEIQSQLDADADGDGFYDASPLAVFAPFDEIGRPGSFGNRDGICSTDVPSQCTPGIEEPVWRWYRTFAVVPPTVCMGALADTTSGYDPPVPTIGGSCFTTTVVDTVFPLTTLSLPLWDTQFAAPWPATSGSTSGGLMRGFLREADADQIAIDLGAGPVVLSSVLPDGAGSCATGVPDGKDIDRGEPGWWMYLEYRLDAASSSGF